MSATDATPHPSGQLWVDEIECAVYQVAFGCLFSSWEIKTSTNGTPLDPVEELIHLFRRMQSCEAKWMVRVLLKVMCPAEVPEMVTLQCFHFLLLDLPKICNSLSGALGLLKEGRVCRTPVSPDTGVVVDVGGRAR
jgi:hypothetical protein